MNAYILAGGRSRRMGASKASLFLERIANAARPVFDDVFSVQRAGGAPLPVATIFEDAHQDEGPLFGIARALEHARGKCFVLAVDYPLVTAAVLQFLAEAFERSRAAALVPLWDGEPQPLCAGYDASLGALVEQRIDGRAFDLRGLIAEAGAEMIAEAELRRRFPGEPLMNVNTPEELEKAVMLYGR